MTPFASGTFIPALGVPRRGRSLFFLLVAIILIGAVTVAGVAAFQAARSASADAARPVAGEAVDGWMSGVAAANRAARLEAANAVQDGWSSYLLRAEPEVVDGWSSYLLRPEPEITDGWATRYLVSDDD